MRELRELDLKILKLIASNPNQITPSSIASSLKESPQNVNTHLNKLVRKELIHRTKRGHITTLRLTDKGMAYIINSSFDGANKKQRNHLSSVPNAPPQEATNLHALQMHYKPFPTYYSRLEATLETYKIEYKKVGNRKTPQYIIQLTRDIKLKATTRKLIAWGPKLTKPINIDTNTILDIGANENIKAVSDFVHKVGIRCQVDLKGNLLGFIRYYELAITNDEIAKRLREYRSELIPLAYNSKTGKLTIWLDGTPAPAAIETSNKEVHMRLRPWYQGVQDGEISPYEDELETRRKLDEFDERFNRQLDLNDGMLNSIASLATNQRDMLEGYARPMKPRERWT